MKTLLFVLIFLSIFFGLKINGEWWFLYTYEFADLKGMFRNDSSHTIFIYWLLLLLAHFAVVSLPFVTQKIYFGRLLIWAPLLFVIIYFAQAPIYIFLLIPFIIIWIISMIAHFVETRKSILKVK